MINNIKNIVLVLMASLLFISCNDYLGTIPKGEKIPQTYEDFNAFLSFGENHFLDNMQQMCLMNDLFKTNTNLTSQELVRINYMWDEAADRKVQDNDYNFSSNSTPYLLCYKGILHWNFIIENADKMTDCTDKQRVELKSQAHILRARTYFHVVNYFADQYTVENAKTAKSIPLVVSANAEIPSPQVTLSELYEFLLTNLTDEIINNLPERGKSIWHPTKASGYGMLARVYLQMGDYDKALAAAQKALDLNSALYDWRPYYLANKAKYDDPLQYTGSYPLVTPTNPEIYLFTPGASYSNAVSLNATFSIPIERAAKFDKGDLRLKTKWKYREYATGEHRYCGIRSDKFNGGGISSPEMYFIKAECLARKGSIKEAMDIVNKVRETRFMPEDYTPLSATTEVEAVKLICKDKANEYLQTAIPFWDMRRLNKDPKYATTLTKVVNGVTYTLKPDSHMWIMPFAESTINNPGNNPIEQNTIR